MLLPNDPVDDESSTFTPIAIGEFPILYRYSLLRLKEKKLTLEVHGNKRRLKYKKSAPRL